MTMNAPAGIARHLGRTAGLLMALTMAALLGASPPRVWAQGADPGQALGQALKALGGAGGLGGLLGGNKPQAPAAPSPALAAGGTGNLIELLMQSVDRIDEPREIEIGRQLAAILLGSKPLHPDAVLQGYVNRLGRWLSLQSPRPNLPWTFIVLDDRGFNAFAAPGGFVFVTKGLVDQARGEAELGGVLAHEIVHVVQKHHLKAMNKTARAGLVTQLLATQLQGDAGSRMAAQLLGLGRNLYTKGLDREDEFQADREGVALAARAGLDPYGLPALLHSLAAARPDSPDYLLALSTHPPTRQRLEQLEVAMGNRLDAFVPTQFISVAQRLAPVAPAPTTSAAPANPVGPAKPGAKGSGLAPAR